MYRMYVRRALTTFLSKSATIFGLVFLALFVQIASAQAPLNYFQNYFVTGDYVVGGVGGLSTQGSNPTATINFSGVPCTSGPGLFAGVVPCTARGANPADIVAAFLYWETIEPTSSTTPTATAGTFDANLTSGPNVNPNATVPMSGLALGSPQIPACVAGGGTESKASDVRVYRADVLRFLAINSNANVRTANYTHTIAFTGNLPSTQFLGATLVVVYRLVTPGNPRVAPLRSVVIYDGAFTGVASRSPSLNQTMGGFYQASFSPDAKMTHIVGGGQRGFSETLTVNGGIPQGVPSDPFVGAQGQYWDNYTFNYNLAPGSPSVVTEVQSSNDCLSWGAIITSTNVQDSDFDGLLDIWETSGLYFNPGVRNDGVANQTTTTPATFGTCTPQNEATCVNFPAMGAKPFVPDIFIQIDWMASNGLGVPNHVHIPQLAALNMVGAVFQSHGINMHFDVGNNYQGQHYIVPMPYAQGGNVVQESSVLCEPNPSATPPVTCNFSPQSQQYSLLSWKTGFGAIKDGDSSFPLGALPQLFALNRKDSFHYALFSHGIAATTPLSAPEAGSISGVGDLPGGDFMVTLGLWRSDIPAVDQVGTILEQAGTVMHELGHNLDLHHGGWNNTPICMPDYPSVMNYLYQVAGLTDSLGNEHIDYSYGLELPLFEGFLSSAFPIAFPPGLQQYKVRYFGPFNSTTNSLLANTPGPASQVFCSGDLLTTGSITNEGQYVLLQGPTVSTPDWSNGTILPLGKIITGGLDINYDGIGGETFTDSPDWLSLNLQQVSARASADGISADLGKGDIGTSDLGKGDIGTSDLGKGDIGTSQLGADALGDFNFTSFVLSGAAGPPTGLKVALYVPPSSTAGGTGNVLNWTGNTGVASQYNVYRCNGSAGPCTPTAPALTGPTGVNSGTPVVTTYTDLVNDYVHAGSTCPATSTCYNTTYYYYVTEVNTVGIYFIESGASNTGNSEVNHLFVIANAQTVQYGVTTLPFTTPLPNGTSGTAGTFTVYGNGSLPTSPATGSPSCLYSSAPRNVGAYIITCSGPSTSSGTTGVTYNAAYLTYTPGGLTITQRPITVTAAASSKTYNASTNSTAIPTITTGNLAPNYGDTAAFTESYDNPNVGTTHVMTAAGIVNDTNGGNNYLVTFVPFGPVGAANGGVITPAPLTITATTNTKTYDGTMSAAATPATSGLQGSDSVTFAVPPETYNTSNVGTNLTLTVSPGYTINDGNGGKNYSPVTTATVNTGVIKPAPVTASIAAANKYYDGTPTATITNCSLAGVLAADTGNVTCSASGATFSSPNAGTWTVTATVSLAGTAAGNYALTSTVGSTSATINPAPVTVNLLSMTQTYSGGPLMPTVTTTPPGIAISLTGAPDTNAGNYPVGAAVTNPNYTGSASGTFIIGQYPLTVTATGVNKDFDGTTNATVTLSDNRISPNDTFTDSYTSASFVSAGPGMGITVNVTGISISGTGATNYALTSTTAATTANISDSINLSALSLNGVNYGSSTAALPIWTGSALQLTNTTTETSSAWLGSAIPVSTAFSTTFQFQITPAATGPNAIGDGFAFVIQGAPSGAATLGATGYGMYIGYDGIPNSIAIEFDTYENGQYEDPAGSHIGIQSLGAQPNTPDHTPATGANLGGPTTATFADGNPHTATITYDGSSTISVYLDGSATPVVSSTVPINLNTLLGLSGGPAYIGFTAATGGAQENSNILTWTWDY
jgi:hypothetical protein